MIEPQKEKYWPLYWRFAYEAAKESYAKKRKVGAVLVMPTGMLSTGWNGMPAGFDNACEDEFGNTRPEVIHAERNAIDKMTRQGISTNGAIIFTTYAPCFECAKSLLPLGLAGVFYAEMGRHPEGVALLRRAKIRCEQHDPFLGKPLSSAPIVLTC